MTLDFIAMSEQPLSDGDASITKDIASLSLSSPSAVKEVKAKGYGIKRGFFNKPKEPPTREDCEFLQRIYHEAPTDVFELILSLLSDRWGKAGGAFNVLRLVDKKLKCLVESCTSRMFFQDENPQTDISSLPTSLFERTKRLRELSCCSVNLKRLDGLPPSLLELQVAGPKLTSLEILPQSCPLLNQLLISHGLLIQELSPIGKCRNLKHIFLLNCVKLVDLSFLEHLPQLEHLVLGSNLSNIEPYVGNDGLTPIGHCINLRALGLCNLPRITDLSFIATCTQLKDLAISCCENISDLSSLSHCHSLTKLDITQTSVLNLNPLTELKNLTKLTAYRMLKGFAVNDLSSCSGLIEIRLTDGTEGVEELQEKFGKRLTVLYDHDDSEEWGA